MLARLRAEYKPHLPALLTNLQEVAFSQESLPVAQEILQLFPNTSSQPLLKSKKGEGCASKPLKLGVLFSGGPAAGGHNVIAGLYDALQVFHPQSQLFGFFRGTSGVIESKFQEITAEKLAPFRNQGGFDLIGTGRTKIETQEQLQASLRTVKHLELDGLVIIGGDDSNTNAAVLAEYFLSQGCRTKVIGVPKTIDGDLQNPYVGISFGFDTACKVYSEIIGNIAKDALSAKKYTHFIKLMGRSASHVTLECALKTQPNYALIGEEISFRKQTLQQIVSELADLICKRSELGKDYGVILIPEGIVEFILESSPFESLPKNIQEQLLLEKDQHGNIQLSHIETERLLMHKVSEELKTRQIKGRFNALSHFLGYEGRAAFPSNFDSHYCYALGITAALLIREGATSCMTFVTHLDRPPCEWEVGGVPLTTLLHLKKNKPVIKKALVNLNAKPFLSFAQRRSHWALEDAYTFPGPMQFFGEPALTDAGPQTLTF